MDLNPSITPYWTRDSILYVQCVVYGAGLRSLHYLPRSKIWVVVYIENSSNPDSKAKLTTGHGTFLRPQSGRFLVVTGATHRLGSRSVTVINPSFHLMKTNAGRTLHARWSGANNPAHTWRMLALIAALKLILPECMILASWSRWSR